MFSDIGEDGLCSLHMFVPFTMGVSVNHSCLPVDSIGWTRLTKSVLIHDAVVSCLAHFVVNFQGKVEYGLYWEG